jgi:hypothetical protein
VNLVELQLRRVFLKTLHPPSAGHSLSELGIEYQLHHPEMRIPKPELNSLKKSYKTISIKNRDVSPDSGDSLL